MKRGAVMMRRDPILFLSVAVTLVCLGLPLGARAQQPPQGGDVNEVPARLRYLEGTVTVQRAAAGETEEAVVNLPLGSGDRVWSDEDGRVEIMLEDGSSLWLDARTTLDFVSLPRPDGSAGAIVRLWNGSVYVQRPSGYGALVPIRLDAPSGAVLLDEAGLFRVDVDEQQTVWLSVYDGTAVLDAGGLSERVGAGERTLAESGSAPARAVAFNTSEVDDFSNWRDQRVAQLASTQQYVGQRDYVPRTIEHYAAELEPYGTWGYHPTYASWYWKPHAAVAWSPYRHGRWVYTYAGWSWVPTASWGYVTTHYGRWHHSGGGWIWFPGSTWSPASVHWYVGGGYVGWVPLNYWGRPAVSFGAHVGGFNVGVSVGGYYGYPYYGYGYPYWGYRPHKRCCNYGWGGFDKWDRWGRHDRRDDDFRGHGGDFDRREAFDVGPIGSARGGRVVNGAGYSSGLADAWTVVPANDFSNRNVGRVALARRALPRDLDQVSKAEVSGTLRARRPATLVSTRSADRPAAISNRRAIPSTGTSEPARANNGAVAPSRDANAAPRRAAVSRSAPAAGVGGSLDAPARRTNAPAAGVRRAVPNAGTKPGVDPAARSVTRSPGSTVPATGTQSPPGAVGRALPRNDSAARSAPTVTGAARRALSNGGAQVAPRTQPSRSEAVRRAITAPRTTSPSSVTTPSVGRRTAPAARATMPTPSVGSRTPTSGSGRSAVRREDPPTSTRQVPTGRAAPAVRPAPSSGGARPAVTPRPSGGSAPRAVVPRPSSSPRPTAAPRPGGGSARPAVAPRPSGGSVRPAARPRPGGGSARPAGAPRPSGGSVRPAARPRPGGGSARPAVAPRPSGGGTRPAVAPRPSGGSVRPAARPRPGGGGVRPAAPSRPGGSARPAARPAKPRGGSGS
jgi:hypothetical protein